MGVLKITAIYLCITFSGVLFANEIVFDLRKYKSTTPQTPTTTTRSVNPLEKSLNNLALADQIYRENLKQTQLLLECNQKLASLEFELNKGMSADDSQPPLFGRPLDAWNTSNPIGKLLKDLKLQLVDVFK